MPLISVVTVTYNCSNLLRKTFFSVEGFKNDEVEYIVVDGGSTDGTLEIIKSAAVVDQWLSEPDKGIFDAMNKGIKLATGRWLIFINAGDRLLLSSPSDIDWKSHSEAGVLYGNTERSNGEIDRPFKFSMIRAGAMPACHQSMFYNKDVLQDAMLYDTSYKLFGENELLMRIDKGAFEAKYVDKVIAFFLGGGVSDQIDSGVRKARYKNLYKHYGALGVARGVLFRLRILSYPKQ